MKKLIVIAALGIAFTGCKKAQEILPSNSITGKWWFTSSTMGGQTTNYNHTDYVEFDTDGSGTEVENGITSHFAYVVSGSNVSMQFGTSTSVAAIKNNTSQSIELDFTTGLDVFASKN